MGETMASSAAARSVKSSERTLALLELLAATPGPVAIAELHRITGYPRSSLHNLVRTMADGGWVELNADRSAVAIGPRALVVGTSYLDHELVLPFATAALEDLRAAVGYTVHFARLHEADVLYLATREVTETRRRVSRVGRFLPGAATALGKAILAERSAVERTAILGDGPLPALTQQTITDVDRLAVQFDEVRERGVAVEREENTPGVSCVAATVRYRIPATDAISVSLPLADATDDEVEHVAVELRRVTGRLASDLQAAGIR